jgi:hypothetical protein
MDSYGEVPLGIEAAWPAAYRRTAGGRGRARFLSAIGIALVVAVIALLAGCDKLQAQPAAAPPGEASVIQMRPRPVALFDDFVTE